MNYSLKWLVVIFILLFIHNTHAELTKRIVINELLATNSLGIKDVDGDYSDWIELYNAGTSSINLMGWGITDSENGAAKWFFPDVSIGAGQYIVLFASGKDKVTVDKELHTNFSLSKDGEYLALYEPDGKLSDEIAPTYPPQQTNISYGVYQGYNYFMEIPTPGFANTIVTKAQIPSFSRTRGYYDEAFYVTLTVTDSQTKIYYSTDGTRPTALSTPYTSPILIDKTTALSAVGIKDEIGSNIVSHTYFFIKDIVKQPNNPVGYPDRWGYLGSDIKYANYAPGERAPADYAMDASVCESADYKAQIQSAFLSIPSVSIVTNPGYLFSDTVDDAIGGIYIHTGVTTGAEWERPASIEFYEPATQKQFQINCGLKLHGAASRQPEKTGKHSFRVAFKGMYGETKLNFNLFDDEDAVTKFDHLIFRAGYNQSWLHTDSWQRTNTQYINDSFAKRIQHDMGHKGTHDRFIHLYINGLYWGLYDITERITDKFMDAYFKGDASDFDVINHDGLSVGELTAFNRMANLSKTSDFAQLQTEKLLYMENFIDYMLLNFYIGNMDWATNNWYMARNRVNPENGFYSFSWDAESSLTDVNLNRINGNNGFQGKFRSMLFGSSTGTQTDAGLYNNPEFKLLFADRINKHFFNGGSLTPDKTAIFFDKLAQEIDLAIILESARWGDYRRNTLSPGSTVWPVYTRNQHWLPRKEKLMKDYFPKRSNIVYKQLEALGLVSEIDPPRFSSYGGNLNMPIQLSITSTIGNVYYTLNGADPREQGSGAISNTAKLYSSPLQLSNSGTVKARVKNGTIWSALTCATFIGDNVSGVNELSDNEHVHYHNSMLYVNLPKAGKLELAIYSVDGKCIQQITSNCNAGNNQIDLKGITHGVYVYRILFDAKIYNGKFIE